MKWCGWLWVWVWVGVGVGVGGYGWGCILILHTHTLRKKELSYYYRSKGRLVLALKNAVSHLVFIRLQSILDQIVLKANNNVEKRHSNKLEGLRRRKVKKASPCRALLDPVTNLSSRVLTDEERAALPNGLHHVYPSVNFDQAQFVCNIEYFYARLLNIRTAYQHYERRSADVVIRHELTSTQLHAASQLRSMANTVRRTAQLEMKRVGKDHRRNFEVLRSLAKDRSITTTWPDKGRGVVILDRSDYLKKMNTILDDPQSFRRIDTDTTLLSEERLTDHLRRMKKEAFISEEAYSLARPVGSMPARIYGLPELHKANCPLRPVMSATKTVGYGLGKVLTRRLDHLRRTPYVVKDTFDFVRRIQASANTNKRMLSFDVSSLFTNVPLSFTIELILDRLYPACIINCRDKTRTRQCKECYPQVDWKKPTMGAVRPRKNSERTLSVLSDFAPLEMTNTEPSEFPMPSTAGARPLDFYSNVRSSSKVCSSWETECIQCSISTPPIILENSIESSRSLAAIGTSPNFEISTARNCLARVRSSQ